MKMINNPQEEPYFHRFVSLGYTPLNYSEKHYIFAKGNKVIKIARSVYNTLQTDESYYIEKAAHDLLIEHGMPVVNIGKIYQKGELIKDFTVLEEDRVEGEIFYRKNCDVALLSQVVCFMQRAAQITAPSFGFFEKDRRAQFSSWRSFLKSVIDRANPQRKGILYKGLDMVPRLSEASFVPSDCNMANFIFRGGRLKCVIDIERPLWGDKNFIYGMFKARNESLLHCVTEKFDDKLVDYYAQIYECMFYGKCFAERYVDSANLSSE